MAEQIVTLEYSFSLKNGDQRTFAIRLRIPSMELQPSAAPPFPQWTRLGFHQCPGCPLKADVHPHCPVAVGLVEVIGFFSNGVSHELADILIRCPNREYRKRAPLQDAVGSLIGLHMVTSGCPILDKLRPMAYTHLPFATVEETLYRAISMYLLAQFLLAKRGRRPDWELKDLVTIYDAVSEVNRAFGVRIRNINTSDANLNALAALDCFAGLTAMVVGSDSLEDIEGMFGAYLQPPP